MVYFWVQVNTNFLYKDEISKKSALTKYFCNYEAMFACIANDVTFANLMFHLGISEWWCRAI